MQYSIELLDNSRNFKARVQITPELNREGDWLKFSKKLSDWGTCTFRVATKDPLFTTEGDILQPFKNHVRINRGGVKVWQGVIVKNPERNKKYIEVQAHTYEYLLSRVLIRHDAADGKGAEDFRRFKSGTMATAITTILTEAIADMGTQLSGLTTGTVENPAFPANFKDTANNVLTGTWTFSDNFQVPYDYRDILYVIQTFGMYGNSDFNITDEFVFNFKKSLGNKQPDLKFFYKNEFGNIRDYNLPLDGDRMANYIVGVAADNEYNILHQEVQDNASIATYGKISAVAAYGDVKDKNLLQTRVQGELNLVKTPDPEAYVVLNDKAYPLGTYGVGDTVPIAVQDHIIDFAQTRRIVGIDVTVQTTGQETIKLYTNKPRDDQ